MNMVVGVNRYAHRTSVMDGTKQRPQTAAFALKIVSTIFVAGNVACVKLASVEAPIGQIVTFRGMFALPVLFLYAGVTTGFLSAVRVASIGPHVARAVVGCGALICFFISIKVLPLPIAVTLSFFAPVILSTTAFSVSRWQPACLLVAAALIGIAGVWLVLSAVDHDATLPTLAGVAVGLTGAWLTAIAILKIRALTKVDTSSAIAFYFSLACFIVGLASWPFGWQEWSGTLLLLLALSGVFSAMGHIALNEALARSEASALAPFEYLVLGWAVVAEVLVVQRTPTASEWGGLLLIAAAAIIAGLVPSSKSEARRGTRT